MYLEVHSMKWVLSLMKTISGITALVSIICAGSVDASTDSWISVVLVSMIIFVLSIVSLFVFDKLSTIKIAAPVWFSILCLLIVEWSRKFTNISETKSRRYIHKN